MKDQLKTLQAFLASDKPEGTEPIAVLVMAHLIARADDEMCVRVSWDTLAKCCPVNETTIYRSMKRLVESEWIVKHSGKRRSLGSTYIVQLQNLPLKDFKQTTITDDANKLAYWYHLKVITVRVPSKRRKKLVRPRVQKGWQQRWALVFQQWLNQGFSVQQIRAGCLLAFQRDAQRAVIGPHALKRDFHLYMAAIENQKGETR